MGILNWLRGKRGKPAKSDRRDLHLAFVLLREAKLPEANAVVENFASFAEPGESLCAEAGGVSEGDERKVLSLRLDSGGACLVAMMPVAVPSGEAERAAEFSLSSYQDGWKLPPHDAHLLVTFQDRPEATQLDSISRFTSILAAVVQAVPAVGVYWGNAGATHSGEFFTSVAADLGIVPRIMLWTGVSVAREPDGRMSLLSLGMSQLSLPDLLLVAGPEAESSAFEYLFDLLAYVVDRGEPIGEGETVGRTAEQRLPVRYVPSPLDAKLKVWRVEFP